MKNFLNILSVSIVAGILTIFTPLATAGVIFTENFNTPALPNSSANYSPTDYAASPGSFPEIASWSGDSKIYGSGNWLDPFSGSQYIVFNPTGLASSNPCTISWQPVASTASTYSISWDYRIWSAGGTESLGVYINNVLVATFADSGHEGAPQGALESYSTDFVSTGGPLTFKLVDLSTGDSNKNIAFDNIEITLVPEPASMALLAICGLVLMRRRR